MSESVLVDVPGVGLVLRRVSVRDRTAVRLRFASLDLALAAGEDPESRPSLALRARCLIAPRMRRRLARSLRRCVAMSCPRVPGGPAAGRHVAQARYELLALADRLEALAPVSVRGVALVCVLLTDGGGPLHRNRGAHRLIAAAHTAGAALAAGLLAIR
jgi:hypothetical protein